jgi:AMMECR1 domain-containing protein
MEMANVEKDLLKCFKRGDKDGVESVWKKHGEFNTYQKKIRALRYCIGNPKTFYSSGKIKDPAEAYAIELEIFFLGKWQIAKLYDKMR